MLDLKELERRLDEALDKETTESLKEWMRQKEREESNRNVAEGDAVGIVSGLLPPLQKEVLGKFKLPIQFAEGYLFDANDQMVGEIRAWGHLQRFPNGEQLQDELGAMICSAFNEKFGGN